MNKQGRSVGIVSDCPLQRHLVKTATQNAGYDVRYCREPERFSPTEELPEEPDAWILMIKDEERWADISDLFLEKATAPILFADEEAPGRQSSDYDYWQRRLLSKLKSLVGQPEEVSAPEQLPSTDDPPLRVTTLQLPEYLRPGKPSDKVEKVVVLVASLGGPAAVKAFIDCLPPQVPAAFIYAQHIDQAAAQVLLRVLGRHGNYPFREPAEGVRLHYGEVMLVPIEKEFCFTPDGNMQLLDRPWSGPYSPNLNQVLLNVSDYFGARTHVIAFSGMGEDGAQAAPLLKAYGSTVWCQSSDSCANSSMVDAIAATGCVDFRGTPEALAEKLLKSMENETLLNRRNSKKG